MQARHTYRSPKISLIFWDLIRSVSDIKLIRTDFMFVFVFSERE
jgi:hypothetical protein